MTTTPPSPSQSQSQSPSSSLSVPEAPPSRCPVAPVEPVGPGGIRRLFGPEAEDDMSGLCERLREEFGAVAPVLVHGDLPAWLVLGYQENLEVMRNSSRFSRDSRRWTEAVEGRLAPDNPLIPIVAWQPMCPFADGEDHKRLRDAVNDSMARIDTVGLRHHIVLSTGELVEEFGYDGKAELIKQFTEFLPLNVLTKVLGMDEEYGPRLVEAAWDMLKATPTAIASSEYVGGVLRHHVTRRKDRSEDDFASWLLAHPAELTDDEVAEHLKLVLIAANETTGNLLVDTIRTVLTDPRYQATLSGAQMTVPEAVERSLWDHPPFAAVYGRWATGNTDLGGQRIKAGDMLIVGVAQANLDPIVRPDPVASLRGNRAHLSFGSGAHECPGQDIARVVAEIGTDALLARLPDMRLAGSPKQLRWKSSPLSKHLTALPVEFTPMHELPSAPYRAAAAAAAAAEDDDEYEDLDAEPEPESGPEPKSEPKSESEPEPESGPESGPEPVALPGAARRRGWWGWPLPGRSERRRNSRRNSRQNR